MSHVFGTIISDTDLDSIYQLADRYPLITEVENLTGKTSDITTTAMNTNVGLNRIQCILQTTTADVLAGAVTLTIAWTDVNGSRTLVVGPVVLTALGSSPIASSVSFLQVQSGNVTFAVSHTGIFGTAVYAVRIILEKLY